MRKNISIPIIIILGILLMVACRGDDEKNMKTEKYVDGFIANDAKTLNEILTNEYTLIELEDYFGKKNQNETIGFGGNDNETLYIRDVDKLFKVECLRTKGYTVYKVKEGGYYYVFWSKVMEKNQTSMKEDAAVYFSVHIKSLKKEADFSKLTNEDTAMDVFEIDKSMELQFLLSNGIYSYSLLDDGNVVEIKYGHKSSVRQKDDLKIKEINIIHKNKELPSRLASIMPKDLP